MLSHLALGETVDSVQNDISVLFDAAKVQINTNNKQTKNQVFESILNSLQQGTKKTLSLDRGNLKKRDTSHDIQLKHK